MSSLLLAKAKLPPDVIDVSVGEPYVIKECLSRYLDLTKGYFVPDPVSWEYPTPRGYQPLVDLLEEKYQAPVIITNGAKQALGAIFYSLKKKNFDEFHMRSPYWALIPPLANAHGLTAKYHQPLRSKDFLPYLLLAPNNPDGECQTLEYYKHIADRYKDANIPYIHDAAYFTHTYLPPDYDLGPIGDVQIFSASKMFGLSGLRIGYVVCYDESYVPLIQEYMEMMTVGVSIIPQQMIYNIFSWDKENSFLSDFEKEGRAELIKAKKLMKAIPSEILEVPENMEDIPGMFGWFKVGPKADFKKAKVNVIDGALFGKPGYVRMNLAIGQEKLCKVISRLCYLL